MKNAPGMNKDMIYLVHHYELQLSVWFIWKTPNEPKYFVVNTGIHDIRLCVHLLRGNSCY